MTPLQQPAKKGGAVCGEGVSSRHRSTRRILAISRFTRAYLARYSHETHPSQGCRNPEKSFVMMKLVKLVEISRERGSEKNNISPHTAKDLGFR